MIAWTQSRLLVLTRRPARRASRWWFGSVQVAGNNGQNTEGRDHRDPRGRFAKGNPGRPKGARHRVTRHVEALMEGDADRVTRAIIEAAAGGDMQAARIVMDRLAPPRREATVAVDLPTIETAADLPGGVAAILQAVSAGDLTPSEASRLSGLLADAGRALETAELEERLAAIEERLNA